jgi:hypothetical protein
MTKDETLSKMNREIGETLIMVGSIKGMLDEHKEVHTDIKNLLEKHDARIASIEESRTRVKAVMWIIGLVAGAFGTVVAFVAKALAN